MLRAVANNPQETEKRRELITERMPLYFADYLHEPYPKHDTAFQKACYYHFYESLSENEKPALSIQAHKSAELILDYEEFLEDPEGYCESTPLALICASS